MDDINMQASEREKFDNMFGEALNRANIFAADMPATVAAKLRSALWDARALSPPAVQAEPLRWKFTGIANPCRRASSPECLIAKR